MINYDGRRFRPVGNGIADTLRQPGLSDGAETSRQPGLSDGAETSRQPGLSDGAGGNRVAVYRQDGNLIWGEFSGGYARRGALTGTCGPNGTLEFAYCMVLESGEVISGRCSSTPSILDDGRIQLDEVWERYGQHADAGISRLEEIP